MAAPPIVVGLGEILWDMLAAGRQLGGAPANFAYCSHLLGNQGTIASRVGNDQLGRDIRERLASVDVDDHFIQTDSFHPTGTVRVQLDSTGHARYEFPDPVAWDFLEWTEHWEELAKSADAICFGSLAQRSRQSQNTTRKFLDSARADSLRVFDINLRQSFYSAEIIMQSLHVANAMKLNQEEVAVVKEILAIDAVTEFDFCQDLIQRFDLKFVCISRGEHGSLVCNAHELDEHPGFRATLKDTIGAGDAFTAALVHEYLRGGDLRKMNESANRMGAWVTSHSGAMPPVPPQGIDRALLEIG